MGVIWVIGLAAAGKTAVGRAVYERVRDRTPAAVFLDGDDVRRIMGDDLGHTLEDRRANAWRICRLCHHLDGQGIEVVCSNLSNFPEARRWNREHYSRYFEVFLDVPMEVLRRRDPKGLYRRAACGEIDNVVGVDLHFDPPGSPDLVLCNGDGAPAPAEQAAIVLAAMERCLA